MYKGDEKLFWSALCKEVQYRKYSWYRKNALFTRQKVESQETYWKPQTPVDEDGCVNGCKVDIVS